MEYRVSGTFYQTNPAQVQALLDHWLGETLYRSRLFGHTWALRTDRIDLHLEISNPACDRGLLDVRLSGTVEESIRWMEGLVAALLAADILYLLTFTTIDEQDPEREEEVTYAHPDFAARYVPRLD